MVLMSAEILLNRTDYILGLYPQVFHVVNGVSSLHWIRFSPSAALSATVDINEIIPACIDVNYGYFEGGVEYHYPIDTAMVGAIETDMAGEADTLNITWVRT